MLLSTLAPGCYVAWRAAQWSPLGGCAALAHTAAPAAISYCESLLGPRSLDTPGGTRAHAYTDSAESFIPITKSEELIFSFEKRLLFMSLNKANVTLQLLKLRFLHFKRLQISLVMALQHRHITGSFT